MPSPVTLLVASLDSLKLGLPVDAVDRVLRAAEITPVGGAPAAVLGIVNVHGDIVPVVDLRARFRLPSRTMQTDDQLVTVRSGRRLVAIVVDEAAEVATFDGSALVPATDVLPGVGDIRGVVRLEDGLMVVKDPQRFLDVHEWAQFDAAMDTGA